MFRHNCSVGGRFSSSRHRRVRPVLVSLEDRGFPSSLAGSGYLLLPPEADLPGFQAVRAVIEGPVAPSAPAAGLGVRTSPAGLGSLPEPALGSRLIPDDAPSGVRTPTGPAPAASPAAAASDVPVSRPAGIDPAAGADRADELTAGHQMAVGTRQHGSKHPAPKITGFHVSQNDDGTWTITGHVKSDFAPLLSVNFGSSPDGTMPSIDGQGTRVDDQGNFQFTTSLQPCEHGMVTAQTSADPNGKASKKVEDYVSQTGCGN